MKIPLFWLRRGASGSDVISCFPSQQKQKEKMQDSSSEKNQLTRIWEAPVFSIIEAESHKVAFRAIRDFEKSATLSAR